MAFSQLVFTNILQERHRLNCSASKRPKLGISVRLLIRLCFAATDDRTVIGDDTELRTELSRIPLLLPLSRSRAATHRDAVRPHNNADVTHRGRPLLFHTLADRRFRTAGNPAVIDGAFRPVSARDSGRAPESITLGFGGLAHRGVGAPG